MLGIVKALTYGATIGITIGGVWNLQDLNYYLGTLVGVALLAGWVIVLAKKGN